MLSADLKQEEEIDKAVAISTDGICDVKCLKNRIDFDPVLGIVVGSLSCNLYPSLVNNLIQKIKTLKAPTKNGSEIVSNLKKKISQIDRVNISRSRNITPMKIKSVVKINKRTALEAFNGDYDTDEEEKCAQLLWSRTQ